MRFPNSTPDEDFVKEIEAQVSIAPLELDEPKAEMTREDIKGIAEIKRHLDRLGDRWG
jgi:hypothetical protein